MSEQKPVWDIGNAQRGLIEGMNQLARVAKESLGAMNDLADTRRVWITDGVPVIRDTGLSVVELLRCMAEEDDGFSVLDKYPQLEVADADHALLFAARCVEQCGRIQWVITGSDGVPVQVGLPAEEAVCDPDLMPPLAPPTKAPLHIQVMAFGAGGLMCMLALLVGWFLLLQLWGG